MQKLKLVMGDALATADISRLIRADIEQRDWSKVHIAGDKAKPLDLPLNWKPYR